MTDILILTHVDFCPAGHLAKVLDEQRLTFEVLRVDLGELDGYDLDRPRAVAVMGGPMSVNDPLPWIAAEIAALRHFIQRDIPLIGHCLGGQLIAKSLGARVNRMPYTEVGWQPLQRSWKSWAPFFAFCDASAGSLTSSLPQAVAPTARAAVKVSVAIFRKPGMRRRILSARECDDCSPPSSSPLSPP